MSKANEDAGMDSMFDASFELVPVEMKRSIIPSAWQDIAEFLRAPKAARYPTPADFAQTRMGPL